MTTYQKKIDDAFRAISQENGGKGASAAEVTARMRKDGTIGDLDTVIDIADEMAKMYRR